MVANDFMHANRKREIVGRILEQRIPADVYLVEVDARKKRRQPKRLLVGDEMDLVATTGERDAKLRRNGAGAAVRRIASDTNLHADLLAEGFIPTLHSAAMSCQSPASGLRRVTRSDGS